MPADATFYNKMPFEIKMRKIWVTDNPPVRIPPGGTIVGPYDLLSQYTFLAPLHVDFSRVETVIQGSNFEYRDELLEPNKEIKVISGPETAEVEKNIKEVESNNKKEVITEDATPEESSEDVEIDINNPPNWLSVKVKQLVKMAETMGINISHTANMKPKDKKWELVKLVKEELKKRQDAKPQ
jgi:hypothetical protein